MTATWAELELTGTQQVRDLWQRKALGSFPREFSTSVPAHGAVMVKISK
jgi:alpha-galactosidase